VAKIHLGIICGNEAANITRFLDSFQPHVDSVSVVRACGNQTPDETLDIAKARGCITGEYVNGEAGKDWPHVDSFCAARNQSFALAPEGTEWLMWADCDDLLSPTAEQMLAEMRAGREIEADIVYSPYVVSAQGSYARRIRLIRATHYTGWINAVHEDIEHDEKQRLIWAPDLQIMHMPGTNKRSSVERNRRILESIPEDKRTSREWWFLYRECEVAQDIPAALAAAVVATGRDDLHDEEKFQAYLSIGRWLKDIEEAERPLLEAVRLMPHRREGYAELVKAHLARGKADKAVAYANAMEAHPAPEEPSWTHDASLYGWRAYDLKAAALAKAGRTKDADRLRRDWTRRHKPRIAVGHPTCRPDKAIKIRELWLERAARPELVAYFFGVNEADHSVVEGLSHLPHEISQAVPEGHSSAVANYNAAARAAASAAKVVVIAQDDIYPPHGWDEQIIRAMEPHKGKPAVLHVFDGFRRDKIMVIPCFNWNYWAGRKWLFNPEFDGYWSDTEWSWRVYKEGVVVEAPHIQFYHDHPLFTGAASDAEYMRQQNPEAERRGRLVFEKVAPDAVGAGW
jgi:hypothetical protein